MCVPLSIFLHHSPTHTLLPYDLSCVPIAPQLLAQTMQAVQAKGTFFLCAPHLSPKKEKNYKFIIIMDVASMDSLYFLSWCEGKGEAGGQI